MEVSEEVSEPRFPPFLEYSWWANCPTSNAPRWVFSTSPCETHVLLSNVAHVPAGFWDGLLRLWHFRKLIPSHGSQSQGNTQGAQEAAAAMMEWVWAGARGGTEGSLRLQGGKTSIPQSEPRLSPLQPGHFEMGTVLLLRGLRRWRPPCSVSSELEEHSTLSIKWPLFFLHPHPLPFYHCINPHFPVYLVLRF